MSVHREVFLEQEICSHLGRHGWIHEEGSDSRYDKECALFPEDLIAWIETAHPRAWEQLTKAHGANAAKIVCARLRSSLDKVGTALLLRNGLEVIGLKTTLPLCQFRPALGMNGDLQARYAANRLRVVRQVRYSKTCGNSIDLVLFLNGIPVATAELKSDYTQHVDDAVDQYRLDRLPKAAKGNATEPLLSFPGGAIVHFAVSNSLVRMCTRLDGARSEFLPFDRGNGFAAGNPENTSGPDTAYLWEEVWDREGWLEILGRYVSPCRNDRKELVGWLFPRYHQLDSTRRILRQVREEGVGGHFLIEHSAGSGKTNSIAWTAHFLSDLHDDQHRKIFDTVLVVSDRNVLDKQLRRAIENLERTAGVVAVITGDGGSKSEDLREALSGAKKIVVCTIQTFPHALKTAEKLARTKGHRFAVIADEAHSSQSGSSASELRKLLSSEGNGETGEDGGISGIDVMSASNMAARADGAGCITYIAFTATPKAKTMELFGRRPDPDAPAGPGNLPRAFHTYSMRQAIEEGFILDVLRNYTSYRMAFQLTHNGQEMDEKRVDAHAARRGIMGWVRLHCTNISHRVEIVVEHFRQNVAHLLGGQAKAMVVTGSRKEAVRWTRQMKEYIQRKGYGIDLLVAFSGEVEDPDLPGGPFNETNMNPGLLGRDIRDAFDTEQYSILLVANKFQTGFDQPLLCAMYVDRVLGGIQAVQTLSRLNRAHPGKDTTYVVDFQNERSDILAAFRQYYTSAELDDVSDPNVVLDLRNKLDVTGRYSEEQVEGVAAAVLATPPRQADLDRVIRPISRDLLSAFRENQRLMREADLIEPEKDRKMVQDGPSYRRAKDENAALELFKSDLGAYVRAYEFMGQMFDYGNTYYEKLHIFARMLIPLLSFGRERDGIDLSGLELTHHKMRELGQQRINLEDAGAEDEKSALKPLSASGTGQVREAHQVRMAEVVQAINDLFVFEEDNRTPGRMAFRPEDAVAFMDGVVKTRFSESDIIRDQARSNTKEQFACSPDLHREFQRVLMGSARAQQLMTRQLLESDEKQNQAISVLLNVFGLWEFLRNESHGSAIGGGI